MNTFVRSGQLLLAAVTGIVLGTYGFRLIREHGTDRGQADVLRACISKLDSEIKSLEEKCLEFAREVVLQSNRVDLAEEKYQEEKKTNEPLRRQIEKMITQEITSMSQIEKKNEDIKNRQELLGKAKEEIEALQSRNESVTELLNELRSRYQESTNSESRLRTKVASAEKRAAEVEKQLEEMRASLGNVKAELNKAKKELIQDTIVKNVDRP